MKNSITYFFIILFLSIKLIGIHALTHEDDKDDATHCVVCDNATIHNLTPAFILEPQEFSIENTELIINRSTIKHFSFVTSNTIASNQLFGRPPPYSL
ncbi:MULTISPECIES: hypothetical protein [Winogradskyella]|uniref:hypothetical protein n=1 Tax=Winogradskyella TaxID=286104 RepID=UPI0015CC17E0|nr:MULTISPECIES: hypothetical protein [Winogradskyella]QXP79579.1 hypothetical protein H0I32_02745 [Winogradskyella sp. HaHa_3_26]